MGNAKLVLSFYTKVGCVMPDLEFILFDTIDTHWDIVPDK